MLYLNTEAACLKAINSTAVIHNSSLGVVLLPRGALESLIHDLTPPGKKKIVLFLKRLNDVSPALVSAANRIM